MFWIQRQVLLALLIPSVLVSPALRAEVASGSAAYDELGMTPGMAVAVVEGDEMTYAKGFGVTDIETGEPVTADTLFYIASTTKSFTATAVTVLAM